MSLFRRLQSLYQADNFRLEDILTEIVAQVLKDSRELALEWLQQIGATDLPRVDFHRVQTQVTYAKRPEYQHAIDSRVDLVIRLQAGERRQLVFIESKVGSHAGETQLARYLDHLETQRPGLDRVALVFVTRDFEADYRRNCARPNVIFRQTRWSVFHRLLLRHAAHNPLAQQLALFMQEHRMNLRHRFRTMDIVALENFAAAKTLMDETLEGQVRQAVQARLRTVKTIKKDVDEIARNRRYVLSASPRPNYGCFAGYFLPGDEPDGETFVGVCLLCSPGAPARRDAVAAFRDWASHHDSWTTDGLDDDQRFAWLHWRRPLPSFLAEPDHVEAVRNFLLGGLDGIAAFQTAYPLLPWWGASPTAVGPAVEDESGNMVE